MTGYTVHTGSTEKFSQGWDRIFQSGSKRAQGRRKTAAGSKTKKTGSATKSRKKSPSRKERQ